MTDPWCWLALVPDEPVGARTASIVEEDGRPAGWLGIWDRSDEGHPSAALRMDGRAASPESGEALPWLSLCVGGSPRAFDDGGVAVTLRRCLAEPWPGMRSTLLVDWHLIGGAVSAARRPQALADDPFARLFPARILRAREPVLYAVPAPTGPALSRYGSGNPWPWDRYAGQVT